MSRKGRRVETESRSAIVWGQSWEWGLTAGGHVEAFGGDENILKLVRCGFFLEC